jgi:acetolactate synthase-1/2/3 large subunit
MRKSCAQAVVDCLAISGIDSVFGIASGKMMPLLRALSEQNQIRFIGTRNEAAAAMMAAGSYAGTGQIACAFGELGPGSANLVPGVANAFADNLPMLIITTGNATHLSYPSRGMIMELDLVELFKPMTKWSVRLHDGRRAPELVLHAIRKALGGRPGPVHINIPADLLAQEFPYAEAAFDAGARGRRRLPQADPHAVREAAAMLAGARRPLLIAGGGVMHANAGAEFVQLARRLGAPATATQMGLGAIPSDHPNFIGHGGVIGGDAIITALAEADVVLAVGCRFSSWLWNKGTAAFSTDSRLIHIDIDEECLGRNVPAALPIQADAKATLSALSAELVDQAGATASSWLGKLRAQYWAYCEQLHNMADATSAQSKPSPAGLALALDELLPADALVAYDGGHTTFWHNDLISAPAVRTRFHAPGLAQLGFGTAYAIALKAAFPNRPVICTTGDGSFGFTIQELDTARRYNLPVIFVVHNNAAWGIIRAGQHKSGFEFETDLSGTDYAAIARGFGCEGHVIESISDFKARFAAALVSPLPTVLDCRTDFVAHPGMQKFGAAAATPPSDAPLPF